MTPAKISPHNINGYVLTTVGGAVAWQPVPTNTGPIQGIGKINLGGGAASITSGFSSSRTGTGQYTISGFGGIVAGSNYIIQLTVQGDNRIYVSAQNTGNFTVEIRNNTGALTDALWHFTVLQ